MNVISLEFKKCCQCGARATRKIELVEVDEQGVTGATLVKHFCGDHGEPLDRDQLALLVDARDTEIERLTAENERLRAALEPFAKFSPSGWDRWITRGFSRAGQEMMLEGKHFDAAHAAVQQLMLEKNNT